MHKSITFPFSIITWIVIFIHFQAFSQTTINGGNISGTWTKSASPYIVRGVTQIPNNATLTIEPGVTVDFRGMYKMIVKGRIIAKGLPNDSIRFINSSPRFDTIPVTWFDTSFWGGIEFMLVTSNNDTSIFDYCVFEHIKDDMTLGTNGFAIDLTQSMAAITHCRFSNCGQYYGGGIRAYDSHPIIKDNIFSFNRGTSIYGWGTQSVIDRNIISNNRGIGIKLEWSWATIINNVISNNYPTNYIEGSAIYIGGWGRPIIANNTIVNNRTMNKGGGLYVFNLAAGRDPLQPWIINNIIYGNRADQGGHQVYIAHDESDPDFSNNNIEGGQSGFLASVTAIYNGKYENNIDTTPMFIQPTGGAGNTFNGLHPSINWGLRDSSACIDKGVPDLNYPDKDLKGNPRINVCKIDMGAIEFQKGNALIISIQSSNPTCHFSQNGTISATVSGGNPPYSYHWNNGDSIPSIHNLDSGKYVLAVHTPADGCTLKKWITLTRPELFLVELRPDTGIYCHDSLKMEIRYTNYPNPSELRYKWSPASQFNNDTIPNPYVYMDSSIKIKLVATTPIGCELIDSTQLGLRRVPSNGLCIVTVDVENHNVLVWNKDNNPLIKSYRIFKETNVTNNYVLMHTQDLSTFTTYTDRTSNAVIQSNKYKIQVVDLCNNSGMETTPHQTMHLTINKGQGNGWNLIWDPYTGFTVSTYNVYRGTTKNNLLLIGTSSGSNSQYSDLNPPQGELFYQVEVISPNNCNPSKSYNSSKSNIVSSLQTSINTQYQHVFAKLYPIPAGDNIFIDVGEQQVKFELRNVIGEVVIQTQLIAGENQISLDELTSGIYFFVMTNDANQVQTGKLIVK